MSEENNGKINLERRLTTLEVRQNEFDANVRTLKDDVKKIMENHLPHLKTDVESLSRLVKIVGVSIFLAIVVNIIVNLMNK
jgi:hypothetical protein